MENWKIVDGIVAYEVSDLGRIRRRLPGMNTKVGKVLKARVGSKGYLRVTLCINGKLHNEDVHRLVAKAFIPNPLRLPQVNHTGKKKDNRACKLVWISTKEHGRDSARREQAGIGVSFNKASKKWVAYYCPEPSRKKHIGYFDTFKEAKAARDAKVKTL